MIYGRDFSDIDNPARDDVRPLPIPTSVQELPCWIIETRWRVAPVLPMGQWQSVFDGMLSSDALTEFQDCLAETAEPNVMYRARLHPEFGNEVRAL